MDFNFNNLYTNINNTSKLKIGSIGFASDNLEFLSDCVKNVEKFGSFKMKLTRIIKDDIHPFEVISYNQEEYKAKSEDYNNFSYFYVLPEKITYEPLDLHNDDDLNKLLHTPLVKEYGVRNCMGVDTNTNTAILINYDGFPEEHHLETFEIKELFEEWKFLDGTPVGHKIN